MGIKSYEDLGVYQKGFELALIIHRKTQSLPEEERREIGRQLRRASVSIPASIAEGYGRKNSAAEFKHFLRIALGSSNEVCVLLKLAKELSYLESDDLIKEYETLGKQLYRLIENWS